MYFITISANKTLPVTFVLEHDGDTVASTRPTMTYHANDHRGTLRNPFLLDFGQPQSATASFPADVQIYSAIGRRVGQLNGAISELQVRRYVENLRVPSGAYFAVLTSGNTTQTIKIIKR